MKNCKNYINLFRNSYLNNLKAVNDAGIWINLNIIANLPNNYSIEQEKNVLKKYIKYFDSVDFNFYRKYPSSDLTINKELYQLDNIDKKLFSKKVLSAIYHLSKMIIKKT